MGSDYCGMAHGNSGGGVYVVGAVRTRGDVSIVGFWVHVLIFRGESIPDPSDSFITGEHNIQDQIW